VSVLARLSAPKRNLVWWKPWEKPDPYCAVITESTGTSKVSWRVFISREDLHEETIKVMHADKYPYFEEGETKIPLAMGAEYCLRVYKGDSAAFGSGRTSVKITCFDEDSDHYEKTLTSIFMNGPDENIKCFRNVSPQAWGVLY